MRFVRYALFLLIVTTACRSGPKTISLIEDGGVEEQDGGVEDAGAPDAGVDAGPPPVCSLQIFAYPDGYACNSDGDCLHGHCGIPTPGSWPTTSGANPGICTSTCQDEGSAEECASGYSCAFGYSITANSPTDLRVGLYCLPQMGVGNAPSNGTLPNGSPCWKPTDCAGTGAVCGSIDYGAYLFTFCTSTCDDTHACGECQTCSQPFSVSQKYCTFEGPGPIGAECVHNDDCASNFCDGFCTAPCSASIPCPSGSTCEMFTYNGQPAAVCIDPQQRHGTADGAACVFDFECATSSRCVSNDQGALVCTPLAPIGGPCQAAAGCQSGLDCRQFTPTLSECSRDCGNACATGETCFAPDLNTELILYNSNGSQVSYDDNIPGTTSVWSRITRYYAQPGTYYVAVRISSGSYKGKYKLRVIDDIGTATQVWRELPESPTTNDTRETAQSMPFPVELSAELSASTDADYFSFVVPSLSRITLETFPGAPSACLPSAQIGTKSLGQPCTVAFNCQTPLTCDASLLACTSTCVGDADCGVEGATCQTIAGRKICASAAQVGHVEAGATCAADWQCANGALCVSGTTGKVCAVACGTTEAADGGTTTVTCGATSECASALTTSGTAVQACLPLGQHDRVYGATCVLQSDCATGLSCEAGHCAKACLTTDECPYRPTFSENPIVCRPCTDSAQCTTMTLEGSCVPIDSSELYCALPCDSLGGCPSGFSCTIKSPIDSYSSVNVCEPINHSCHAPVCTLPEATDGGMALGSGNCTVPPLAFASMCLTDSECTTGRCIAGFCSNACTTNADCNCSAGDLVCTDSLCQPPAADKVELEPNDSFAMAQLLTSPAKVRGSMKAGGNDGDNYAIVLTAGQKISVTTRPVCGVGSTGASNYILLYDPNGTLATYVTSNGYSRLRNYAVTVAGTYNVRVQDSTYPYSTRETGYILEVTTAP